MSLLLTEQDSGRCTLDEVLVLPIPPKTASYQPVTNKELIDMLHNVAYENGLSLIEPDWGMARNGQRVFGTYKIQGHDSFNGQAQSMLGVRNSCDKSLSAAICYGSEVLVCSNLCFSGYAGEDGIVGRTSHKHTVNVKDTLYHRLQDSLSQFQAFKDFQENFYRRLNGSHMSERRAYHAIVNAARADVVPNKDVLKIAQLWDDSGDRSYSERDNWHEDFVPRNAWSLFNVFTENHKEYTEKNPVAANKRSINLTRFFNHTFMN